MLAVRVVGRELAGCRDVVVRSESGHTVADLCAALGDHLGVAVPGLVSQRTGRVLQPALALGACGLLSGDLLMIGADADVVLDVVGGPDAGVAFALSAGRCLIGRGEAADVSLADGAVSRRHAVLEVGAAGTTLTAIAPVRLNGADVKSASAIAPGDVVSIGRTELVLRSPATTADIRSIRDGVVEFRRTPYRTPVIADRGTVVVGPIPDRHEPRRMQMLSIAGPLLAGLVLFAFMHRVEFLALTLLSPVLLVATTLDDRRAGRRGHRRQVESFREMLGERRREWLALAAAERAERLIAAPDVGDLARRVDQMSVDLWSRGRDDEDFLRLRVGRGTCAAHFEVALAAGGEPDLRDDATAAVADATTITDVPVTVDAAGAVLALQGEFDVAEGVLTSLVLQAACLHSPDVLSISALIAPDRVCDWIKWLPHAREARVARSRVDAETVVRGLLDEARRRASSAHAEPHLLVIIDAELVSGVTALAAFLDLAQAARIAVVWLASDAAHVPHQSRSVLDLGALCRLRSASESQPVEVEVEPATVAFADRVARSLAPVHDVASAGLAGIATDVTLLDVLGAGAASSTTIARWWQRAGGLELRVPIGAGPDGPLAIDLVEDGPHMLVAGTTGSGKSELLQSMVTSIAARYSPRQVNFMFVDYKGGAATKPFECLPHTVGYVTNLDAALARRAIVAMRAELERRMALLEGRAKDLRELRAIAPDEAPAALVIVIDEFATLAKQLPDFVAGIVDIAQRGRSLGIHLVLSTQRLAGAVDENIVANTNVRVALRVIERADSTAMVGSGCAAEIPAAMRGRGVLRVGTHGARTFQSAYGAGPVAPSAMTTDLAISGFTEPCELADRGRSDFGGGDAALVSQQQAVIGAVTTAARALGLTAAHRPWCEPLPGTLALGDLPTAGNVRAPAIGLFDAPAEQRQGALVVDLERGGGCLVFGAGGAGKSTVLRTLAAALTRASSADDPVAILAFEGPSRGMAMVRPLPTVVDVVANGDVEAITRSIAALDTELARRLRALSDVAADDLSAYNAVRAPLPRIVVLIDDIASLADALGGHAGGALSIGESWSERLVRVLVDGRRAGIHGVVTADRRNAVPSRLLTAISNRIVLGLADRASYADHGVPTDAPVLQDSTPGRGWWNGKTVIQIATTGLDCSARGQRAAIESIGHACTAEPVGVLRTRPLPERVSLLSRSRAPRASLTATIGVEDLNWSEVTIDLRSSHLAIVGHARSGRSTALHAIAAGLPNGHEVYAIGTATSGLADAAIARSAFGSPADIAALLTDVTERVAGAERTAPAVLLVDDLDMLDDIALAHVWDRVASCSQLRVVASVEAAAISGFTSNPVASALKRSRQMLVLQPDDPAGFLQLTGARLDTRPGLRWVPGRGVLSADRATRVVQVALPDCRDRRTRVRSHGTVVDVNLMTTQSTRTAAVAPPASR